MIYDLVSCGIYAAVFSAAEKTDCQPMSSVAVLMVVNVDEVVIAI